MPVLVRDTQRRNRLTLARGRATDLVAPKIGALLDRRYKALKRELRRAKFSRKHLGKRLALGGTFYKQGGEDQQEWQEWIDQFDLAVQDALIPAVDPVYGVESQYWQSRQKRPAPVDPVQVVKAYQQRAGRQIKGIGSQTRDDVFESITNWYNTDASLPELITSLGQYFDENRARTIARTEVSYISSQVAYDMMGQFKITYWNWDLGDPMGKYPCPICLAKAQDNPHKIGEAMPPDESHPECRCGVSYADEDGSELIYGQSKPVEVQGGDFVDPRDVGGAGQGALGLETDPERLPSRVVTGTEGPVQGGGALDAQDITPQPELDWIGAGGVGGVGPGALGLETDAANDEDGRSN